MVRMPYIEGPRHELLPHDDRYPAGLLEGGGHAERIYVLGNPDALSAPMAAVVGARKATPYGTACAELAASCAVSMGIGIVSGAAIGCDQASQREALRLNGKVVAVLGSGANVVYPSNAYDMLRQVIARDGAIVSLLPWDTPPARWTFVQRNAVIARLARALVICEAGMPSGTFSTAQAASDAGREVLVFPGSVFSPTSTGSNYLIASDANAMPIWDRKSLEIAFSRIFGRLCSPAQHGTCAAGDKKEENGRIAEALAASPMTAGSLAQALRMDLTEVMRELGRLELGGCARRLNDGRYCLTERSLLARL